MLELNAGALGQLRLGRGLFGADVGRLVLLRSFPEASEAELGVAIRGSESIAGPRLIKVLGGARVAGVPAVASEYVEGVSLVELMAAAADHGFPLSPAVALRILQDALAAVRDARRLFESTNAGPIPRLLFAETVWIAEFGEALLTESGVIGSLLRVPAVRATRAATAQLTPEELSGRPPSPESDVFAAGALLWHLLAAHPLFEGVSSAELERQIRDRPIPRLDTIERLGLPVPAPVVEIVERALQRDPARRFSTAEDMGKALSNLPAGWIATERQVREAITQLTPDLLDARRSRLLLSSRESDRPQFSHWDAPTQSRTNVLKRNVDAELDSRPTVIHAEPPLEATTVRPPGDADESGSRFFRAANITEQQAVSIGAKPSGAPARNRRVAVIAAAAVAAVSLLGVGATALLGSGTPHDETAAGSNVEPANDRLTPRTTATAPAAAPAEPVVAVPAATPSATPAAISATAATAAPHEPSRAKAAEAQAAPAPSDDAVPARTAPSSNKFRPRSIEPYRPKGI
jgi:serine/threonine protein kinase